MLSLACAVALALTLAGTASSQEKPSKEQLQALFMGFLAAEGYRPEIDSDGDVVFKREGKSYFIAVREDDPEFFQIVMPNIWEIENGTERAQVLVAADHSNSLSKVAKVHTLRDNVWVSIELLLNEPEDFKPVFNRSMSAIDNGVANFVEKMRELREQ